MPQVRRERRNLLDGNGTGGEDPNAMQYIMYYDMLYIYIYICIYVYMYICIYVYIYIYIYNMI